MPSARDARGRDEDERPAGVLVPEGDALETEDWILRGEWVWITVGTLSVQVKRTDEGVVVNIYGLRHEADDPVASTYAFEGE